MQQLTDAIVAAQKLEKKLRQLRNQDRATDLELAMAKSAVEIYRKLCVSMGVASVDVDSRIEKEQRRKRY